MRKTETLEAISANPAGQCPQVDKAAFVHPSAQIIGKVRIGPQVFVGPLAVIRADEQRPKGRGLSIVIGRQCNVQDGVILHALGGTQIAVGPGTSLTHGCVVHGPCKCSANCFIGFRAVVFNSVLGNNVFIGSGAIVQNVKLRDFALVPAGATITSQNEADALGHVTPKDLAFMKEVANTNVRLAKAYSCLKAAAEPCAPKQRRSQRR